jgi:hypothetical protein
MEERLSYKEEVGGSRPSRRTKFEVEDAEAYKEVFSASEGFDLQVSG